MKAKIKLTLILILSMVLTLPLTGCSDTASADTQTKSKSAVREEKAEFATDAQRFKYDYESLNNYEREDDGVVLFPVEISDENPFVYITMQKAIEIREKGTGVLFIGSSDCRICRMLATLIIDAVNSDDAKDNKYLDKIYYLDANTIDTQSSEYQEFQEKVLDLMHSYICKYDDPSTNIYGVPKFIESKAAATEEESKQAKMYKFTLSYWDDGKLLGMHVGTTPYFKDSDTPPTDEDKEEFIKRFQEITCLFGTDLCEYC